MRRGREAADELPYSYQAMLFWAGLRGAVGVALAAGMTGENSWALKATVLVVVVLTVIIFGGTTARMLEILGIRTGVVEEIDSDDEFDIETANSFGPKFGRGFSNDPNKTANGTYSLDGMQPNNRRLAPASAGAYASGHRSPGVREPSVIRKNSNSRRGHESRELLGSGTTTSSGQSDEEFDSDGSDLPPAAKRTPKVVQDDSTRVAPYPTSGTTDEDRERGPQISASGAISHLLSGTTEETAAWFKQLDEGFIKPKLLLDSGRGGGPHGNGGPGSSGSS